MGMEVLAFLWVRVSDELSAMWVLVFLLGSPVFWGGRSLNEKCII